MNDFQKWMAAMGYNGKQVAEAGSLLGFSESTSQKTHRGVREMTREDRLVAAAIRAGLDPWSPENDQATADAGELGRIMQRMAVRPASQPSSSVEAVSTAA